MKIWNRSAENESDDLGPAQAIGIRQDILTQIVNTLGRRQPESGGLLGGDRSKQVITRFLFDDTAAITGTAYSPNTDVINTALNDWDAESGDKIIGFIHTHPVAYSRPSGADEEYAGRILNAIPALQRLFLPIAIFRNALDDGTCEFAIIPFVVCLDKKGRTVTSRVPMNITDAQGKVVEQVETYTVRVASPFAASCNAYADDTFVRVRSAYDLDQLRHSRVTVAGVGGSSEFVESLARAGVGQFVLIDPDTVSLTNLATQQTYRRDLGKDKVKVLAERIRDINPSAEVVALRNRLEDLDDAQMGKLMKAPFVPGREAPRRSLLCGCTDSFPAQARVNRLAIQFAVPSLCAQVYLEGRGAEVTFTHPDLTPACHRCALGTRYRAYEAGTVKPVGSEGSNVFATVRVNAIAGFVALALLHAGGNHPRWGGLLRRVGNRNLVMIRMDPDFGKALGLDVFERTFGDSNSRVCCDETIWTGVTPDDGENGNALCPDCGGVGHLRSMEGRFQDTLTGVLNNAPAAAVSPPLPFRATESMACAERACAMSVGK